MKFIDTPLFIRLLEQSPLSRRELAVLIETAPSRYKEHFIEKRNGRGRRLISQPTSELKFFQRILVNNELSDLRVHMAAMAYRQGRAIRQHALPHAKSKYLLKLDFENFFPSLRGIAVKEMVNRLGRYSEDEVELLCRLICKRSDSGILRLSIGAPSSPFISNALMYRFDEDLAQYCLANSVIYTRYADDIALSTSVPGRLDEIFDYVLRLINDLEILNLRLNESKTVNVSRKNHRVLTGLTLANNGGVSIGRRNKRLLRAAMHQLCTQGESEIPLRTLKGRLSFLYSIDPQWVLNLCRRHGFSSVNEISAPHLNDS